MADDLQAFRVTVGDDGEARVVLDQVAGVHQPAVDPARQGGLGETGADVGGHVAHGDRGIETAFAAIREGNEGHGLLLRRPVRRVVRCLRGQERLQVDQPSRCPD